MKSQVIAAIYDTKAEIYIGLNVFKTNADFIRNIQVEAKRPDSMLHKFPADYDLHILGSYSESEGILSSEKKRLGSVLDLCPTA